MSALSLPACSSPRSLGPEATPPDPSTYPARIDAMYADYREDFPEIGEISAEELAALLEGDGEVIIVDVREPKERAVSIIAGSITQDTFEANREQYPKDATIVLHCTIGYRSGKYAEKLQRRGIEALNLKGSILSWVHAGQPVVTLEGEETRRVHVYGQKWNLLPKGYEAVW